MAISRYEPITINFLTRGIDATGAQSITRTLFMNTAAKVFDVVNELQLKDGYRLYTDQTNFQINFSPNSYAISSNQEDYEVMWRGNAWRIVDSQEDNARLYVKLICYRAEPTIQT